VFGSAPVHELGHVAQHPLAVGVVLEHVERVDGVGELDDGGLLGASGAERVRVLPLPVLISNVFTDTWHYRHFFFAHPLF
jgi:hypothetical protein